MNHKLELRSSLTSKSTKFLLPAQLGPDQPMTTALVDVNQFLTSLRLMKQWDLGSPKFWEFIKKQKLDEKIFCSTFSDMGAPTPQTNATTITELKRKIGSDTTHFKTQASVQATQEVDK